jgi:hypothetical protein
MLPVSEHMVVVKTVQLPKRTWLPWYARFADHAWVDLRSGGQWHRVEWNAHLGDVHIREFGGDDDAREDTRWGMRVQVLATFDGPSAQPLAAAVLGAAPQFPYRHGYRAWPGPNSNTFVDWLAREVPGLRVELPPTAVGKDYATWLRVGLSPTGTGVELETMLLGAQVGLREGVEAHFLGLTAGVGLWPPQLKLPFLPGIPFGFFGRGAAAGADD